MTQDDPTRTWAAERARRIRQQLPGDVATPDVPEYGSAPWHQLADNDPRRWLAVLNAAEFHRLGGIDLSRRLEAELSAGRFLADQVEAAQFAEVAAWVRATANAPSHDELQRRRAAVRRPAGYKPRPWPAGETE